MLSTRTSKLTPLETLKALHLLDYLPETHNNYIMQHQLYRKPSDFLNAACLTMRRQLQYTLTLPSNLQMLECRGSVIMRKPSQNYMKSSQKNGYMVKISGKENSIPDVNLLLKYLLQLELFLPLALNGADIYRF